MSDLVPTGSDLAAPARGDATPASTTASAVATPPGSTNVIVVQGNHGPGIFVRLLWYLFIGWWLTGITLAIGYLAGLTVIGLPLAFFLFNRTGTLLTLRPRSQNIDVQQIGGATVISTRHAEQMKLWIRALYFVCIGWWAAGIWMVLAYALSLTLIGLPLGVMMLNRLPEIYTLHRN